MSVDWVIVKTFMNVKHVKSYALVFAPIQSEN